MTAQKIVANAKLVAIVQKEPSKMERIVFSLTNVHVFLMEFGKQFLKFIYSNLEIFSIYFIVIQMVEYGNHKNVFLVDVNFQSVCVLTHVPCPQVLHLKNHLLLQHLDVWDVKLTESKWDVLLRRLSNNLSCILSFKITKISLG